MHEKLTAIQDRRNSEDRGFTLIELLVVVVIIGILIAIAIPLYLNYQKGSKDKSAQSDLRAAVSTIQQCYTDNGNKYPAGTASNTAGSAATFSCSGTTETANLSSGTSFTYAAAPSGCDNSTADCTSFVITTNNSGGNNKTYTYNSANGGTIQ